MANTIAEKQQKRQIRLQRGKTTWEKRDQAAKRLFYKIGQWEGGRWAGICLEGRTYAALQDAEEGGAVAMTFRGVLRFPSAFPPLR